MAKKSSGAKPTAEKPERGASLREETSATRSNAPRSKPSAFLDTRVVYGDMRKWLNKNLAICHLPFRLWPLILNFSFQLLAAPTCRAEIG